MEKHNSLKLTAKNLTLESLTGIIELIKARLESVTDEMKTPSGN